MENHPPLPPLSWEFFKKWDFFLPFLEVQTPPLPPRMVSQLLPVLNYDSFPNIHQENFIKPSPTNPVLCTNVNNQSMQLFATIEILIWQTSACLYEHLNFYCLTIAFNWKWENDRLKTKTMEIKNVAFETKLTCSAHRTFK